MQFYFIRHGQSLHNLSGEGFGSRTGRRHDPELTLAGERQAEILADYLSRNPTPEEGFDAQNQAGFGITHLYSSLMVRSAATGSIIADAIGLPLVAWEELHENGGLFGEDSQSGELIGFPGKNRAYFEAHYPDLILPDSVGATGWWNRPFEEPTEQRSRARRVASELVSRHGNSEDRVAVVSHGGFFNGLIAALLALPATDSIWFTLNNASISRIDFLDGRVDVMYINRVDFLPGDLIT